MKNKIFESIYNNSLKESSDDKYWTNWTVNWMEDNYDCELTEEKIDIAVKAVQAAMKFYHGFKEDMHG